MFYPKEWAGMKTGDVIQWQGQEVRRVDRGWELHGKGRMIKVYHLNGFVTKKR